MHKRLIHIMVTAFVLMSFFSSYARTVMAWVSACDIDDARTELQKFYGIKEAVNVIGLQWWLPNRSGAIKYSDDFDPNDTTIMPPDDNAVKWFRTFADQNGIKLYMCLYNCLDNNGTPFWDWELAKNAFATYPSHTIAGLVNEMERLKLDGIDVDLESPYAPSGDKNADIQSKTSHGCKYWYIVESRRINGKPRPVVLAYLGSAYKLLQRLQATANNDDIKLKSYSHGAVAALLKIAIELDIPTQINHYIKSP